MGLGDAGVEPVVGAQPAVIALMLDASAPTWKRENAAYVLADHGTAAALEPLAQMAAQSAPANEPEPFNLTAASSLFASRTDCM